jgi:alpha-galactosidase
MRMLAPTPPMGWNSWNTFGGNIDGSLIRESADAFLDQGLRDAGYQYVVIDDHWEAMERDASGRLVPDPDRFPTGIAALAEYVHSRGLKFGIYSCAGTHTCGGRPASYGNEEIDALTFADWGVDFLKYDFCYKPAGVDGPTLYRRMGQALRASGRRIVFSICNWGGEEVWKWGASVGGHMWRTTGDILDTWESIEEIGFGQAGLESYAGPNHWNDPDMLVVGMCGRGNDVSHTGCTDTEYRTHFSLWCMLASPLMMGCDVRSLRPEARAILTHPELIAVNQDPAGRQGFRIGSEAGRCQVWAKPLSDGSLAVALFNRHDRDRRTVPIAWESVGLHDRRAVLVRDLWAREDVGVFRGSFCGCPEPHGCQIYKLTPEMRRGAGL